MRVDALTVRPRITPPPGADCEDRHARPARPPRVKRPGDAVYRRRRDGGAGPDRPVPGPRHRLVAVAGDRRGGHRLRRRYVPHAGDRPAPRRAAAVRTRGRRAVTRALKLLVGTVALWLMAGSAMSLLRDGLVTPLDRRPTLVISGLAMAVALLPALAAAVLDGLLERGTAETQTVGLLLGVAIRLAVTMALAVAVDRMFLPPIEASFRAA